MVFATPGWSANKYIVVAVVQCIENLRLDWIEERKTSRNTAIQKLGFSEQKRAGAADLTAQWVEDTSQGGSDDGKKLAAVFHFLSTCQTEL